MLWENGTYHRPIRLLLTALMKIRPLGKGFDRFYGFLEDSTDQYKPELFQDNSPVDVPKKETYHLSADLVDRRISM